MMGYASRAIKRNFTPYILDFFKLILRDKFYKEVS